MAAFQVCARCATRWPVGTRPAVWCPRCHGVLLSPVSTHAPAQGQRNFTWVARRPRTRSTRARSTHPPRRTETPRYDEMPRWGLVDRPALAVAEREPRVDRWAGAAAGLLTLTAALLILAVLAELLRYAILLHNRTRLIDPTLLVVSDALVLFAEIASVIIGIGAAVASVCWLITRRRIFFGRNGTRDPRRARTILVGCLVPVLSLVMPGVFLTELVDARGGSDRDRLLVVVRVWWAGWIVDWILVLAAVLWRLRDSLQAQADGVLLSAVVALVGAAVASTTIYLMRSVDGLRLRGGSRAAPTRWVVAVTRDTEQAGESRSTAEAPGPEAVADEKAAVL